MSNKEKDQDDIFKLEETQASSYLDQKKQNDDGLLRPKLEEGKDGKRELVIRFLPNLMVNGKIGPTAVEKHIHYADFKQNPELQGYFDCLKNANIAKDCPLCRTFWNLKNSKNPEDNDKAKLINRTTKYYSYVMVVEDDQKPDNVGKIFIYPFGFKIFQKIKAMAEAKRKPCKVEDLIYGANLCLKIEEVGGFMNYDSSYFEAPEPISIGGIPLSVDADGKISSKERERALEFLKSREYNLEDYVAKDWTPEQYDTVDKIIAHLSGANYVPVSKDSAAPSKKQAIQTSDVFENDDDEDEEEVKTPPAKAKKEPVAAKKEEGSSDIKESRSKAKAFFDDEDEE